FRARLENLPLPFRNKNLGNRGDLNQMVLGVFNAHNGTGDRKRFPQMRVDHIDFEGPVIDVWPPESHTRIFFESPNKDNSPVYAREVLKRFMDRAYRRPASQAEVDQLFAVWRQLWDETRPREPVAKTVEKVVPPEPGIQVDYFESKFENAQLATFNQRQPQASAVVGEMRVDLPIVKNRDAFALRFTGGLTIERPGVYTFYTSSDDGSRLFVDGREIVDNDGLHGMAEANGKVKLAAGSHAITVTYFNGTGGNGLTVSWEGPGIDKQLIPKSALTVRPGTFSSEPVAPSFEETIRDTLTGVLISPGFLYLAEPDADRRNAQRRPLNHHEVASRLSYFLWSTAPDEELLGLAAAGKLRTPSVLKQQADRMLADSRSWMFVENFTDQWLELDALERTAVNKQVYSKLVVGL
ncbi:MAG: DUF1592 domain-containing protein, partial [Planctomycetales bacterium]